MSNQGNEQSRSVSSKQLHEFLTTLKADFAKSEFEGLSASFHRDHNNEFVAFSIQPPIHDPGPEEPQFRLVENSLLVSELEDLFRRAGHLLAHIPHFGVRQPEFRDLIRRSKPGTCRWAAFMHCFKLRKSLGNMDDEWIDDVARASAVATGELITQLAANEKQPGKQSKKSGPKPDPAKDRIEALHAEGITSTYAIVEALSLKKRNGRAPVDRVKHVINAMQQRRRNRKKT